jgi:hypothetical protein
MLGFRRGGVSGGGFNNKGRAVGVSSSLPSTFKGGVWVSELDDESVNILSLSFSSMSTVWLRLLAWNVKEVASGLLSSLVSER